MEQTIEHVLASSSNLELPNRGVKAAARNLDYAMVDAYFRTSGEKTRGVLRDFLQQRGVLDEEDIPILDEWRIGKMYGIRVMDYHLLRALAGSKSNYTRAIKQMAKRLNFYWDYNPLSVTDTLIMDRLAEIGEGFSPLLSFIYRSTHTTTVIAAYVAERRISSSRYFDELDITRYYDTIDEKKIENWKAVGLLSTLSP